MRLLGPARVLFAAASVSLAVLSLTFGDSVLMGQSVPAWMPWRETWVYGEAVVLLIAGAALCFPRTAAPGALTIGACLAGWAVTCTPQIASNPLTFGGWYGFCEAMTSLAGAWLLYALLHGQHGAGLAARPPGFGLLVWVPNSFALPRPTWAETPQNQWSELVVNLVLAAAAWVVTLSLTQPSEPNPPMSS